MKLLSLFTFLFPYEGTDTTMVNATMSLSCPSFRAAIHVTTRDGLSEKS